MSIDSTWASSRWSPVMISAYPGPVSPPPAVDVMPGTDKAVTGYRLTVLG